MKKIGLMNIDEIEELQLDISDKLGEIAGTLEKRSGAGAYSAELPEEVEKLSDMVEEIVKRKAELSKAAEMRRAMRENVAEGRIGETMRKVAKDTTEETEKEIRSSTKYARAYLNIIKNGDDKECRALLSTNASSGGYVPVPTMLEDEIRVAWERCEIASLCKHSAYQGNVKIGFELSTTGAVIHAEGAAAPDEEVVTMGSVELKADMVKKWISISDITVQGTTVDTMGYIMREIAQKIAEKVESEIIGKIKAAPTTSTTTAPAVKEYVLPSAGIENGTIVKAMALLSGTARNLNIAMNRRTYAAFMEKAMNANHAIDIFAGLRERVVFTDALGDLSSASTVVAIIGDFNYGYQINNPSGNGMEILQDPYTHAKQDLIDIIGKQLIGHGVVAEKAFVRIKTAASE